MRRASKSEQFCCGQMNKQTVNKLNKPINMMDIDGLWLSVVAFGQGTADEN